MYSTLDTTLYKNTIETSNSTDGGDEVTETTNRYEKTSTITNMTTSKNLLEIPTLTDGYTIVGTETYMKEKRRRPLSLSSIHDLRIVKEGTYGLDDQDNHGQGNSSSRKSSDNRGHEERKQRIRTLVLASAALARFKHHASVRRKEKKQSIASVISPRLTNQATINDRKRLSTMETDELFDCSICRR